MTLRSLRLACLLVSVLLGACEQPPDDSPADDVQHRLVGTWLREYDESGAHVRRILVLEADGAFREMSSIAAPGAADKVKARGTGHWLFDGTNLKRRYASINGKALSAPTVPFVTFEIGFPSKTEFVGIDHVHKVEVHYERVAEGTLP